MAKESKKQLSLVRRVLPYVGVLVALCVMLYYPVSEMIDAYRRAEVAATLDLESEQVDDSRKQEMLAQATAWNRLLAGLTPDMPSDEILPYEQQLSDGTTDAFAYVVIPKINLTMPLYHGLSDAVLSAGAGHSPNSSLPIGGESTHTVISGHSGMAGMRAFDDVRQLVPGDVIGVRVLGEMRCWRVTSSEVVDPERLESLGIRAGEDLLSLVTCTPYGINEQRLLVHAVRCEVPEGFGEQIPGPVESLASPRAIPAVAGVAVVVLVCVIGAARKLVVRRRRRGSHAA